jgi:3-phosphoshikimate 1-carboxyvinyltransferase
MKTLYLYGPPASGKTTLARRLARECGRMYVDLDEEIVRRAGCSIPEIFGTKGEAEFRRMESEALRAATAPIVALGGGTLLDPSNRAFAEEHGFVAVLDVDDDTIAARIAAGGRSRPLGNMLAERRAHYASFAHHVKSDTRILLPRKLRGAIRPPVSKSHLHRLLIAEFLAGGDTIPSEAGECADIDATRRCISALAEAREAGSKTAVLDCGESGSTLRFFAPIAAALGIKAEFVRRGRLAERPMIEYDGLKGGVHELRGDVSSQFVTGLLFALPLLEEDSEIRFTSPLESRGYVDMTLQVLERYGIEVDATDAGFFVRGSQRYVSPGEAGPEADWSGAAFWFAANALGSEISIEGLDPRSRQPDAVIAELIEKVKRAETVDVSGCPDNYPALAAVNKALGANAVFTGTERLRIKESDRLAAMEDVFADPYDVDPKNDHRIAMAAAIYATSLDSPVLIHTSGCVCKSYPRFWDELKMDLYAVTGWPLLKTSSPEIHNAAHARAARKAEMVPYPAETAEEALRFAERCDVKGMAVTIPHKESVMRYLDFVDDAAREIGAVNTVVFKDGRKLGYNTDETGFARAILEFTARESLSGMKVALLGAGGAAKAVLAALRRLGAETEVFHRRALTQGFDLIVNATPVDPIAEYSFSGREMVYDLRYVPAVTPLMERASAAGCRVANGYSMLVYQAQGQLELFAQ